MSSTSSSIRLRLEPLAQLQIGVDGYAICWHAERLSSEKTPLYQLRIYEANEEMNLLTNLIRIEYTKATCRLIRKLPTNKKCYRIAISEIFSTDINLQKTPEQIITTQEIPTIEITASLNNPEIIKNEKSEDQLFIDIFLRHVEG